jgi:hypothetical protein
MKLGQFIKQPGERESYTVNYENDLTEGDNVMTAAVTVTPVGMTVDPVNVFDPRVRFWASGGINGVSYKVTLTVTTADGRVLEDEVTIKVKEQ